MNPLRSFVPALALAAAGLVSLALSADPAGAQAPLPDGLVEYEVDPVHTQVMFKVRHMGVSTVTGEFNRFAATFAYDPADLASSWVTATIDAASIDTDNDRRDNHLRSPDFFAADSFPNLTFQSTSVEEVEGGRLRVSGDLSIRGVTKPVVLDVVLGGATMGQGGQPIIGWTAETTVNRKDYGLMWNRLTEAGGWVVGDEVRIVLEVEAQGSQ
ncbi:MAG TPA: YceI family protein [Gemmatimonadota bacterium]|nr:YceI family protein [Gemmatimonadota bacterium]